MTRPSYSAVHQSFTAFVGRALREADLPVEEQLRMQQATQHWLRRTFATRSAEANVPPDVLQAEMGHRDPAMTEGLLHRGTAPPSGGDGTGGTGRIAVH